MDESLRMFRAGKRRKKLREARKRMKRTLIETRKLNDIERITRRVMQDVDNELDNIDLDYTISNIRFSRETENKEVYEFDLVLNIAISRPDASYVAGMIERRIRKNITNAFKVLYGYNFSPRIIEGVVEIRIKK